MSTIDHSLLPLSGGMWCGRTASPQWHHLANNNRLVCFESFWRIYGRSRTKIRSLQQQHPGCGALIWRWRVRPSASWRWVWVLLWAAAATSLRII